MDAAASVETRLFSRNPRRRLQEEETNGEEESKCPAKKEMVFESVRSAMSMVAIGPERR
jgi:hypothetical protein